MTKKKLQGDCCKWSDLIAMSQEERAKCLKDMQKKLDDWNRTADGLRSRALEKLIEEMRRIVVEESKKVEQLDRKLNGDDRRYGDWNPKRWEARQTPDATRDLRRMQREIGNAIDELMPSLLDYIIGIGVRGFKLRALEAIWELKEGIDASIDLTELYDQIDAGARQVAAELFKPLIERLKRELEKGNNGDRDALYFAVAAVLAMHGLVEQLEKEREYAGRHGDRYRDCILLITGAIKAVPVATYNQETGKVEYRYPEPPAVPLRWF